MVKDGEVLIVDEFTGRLMPGRRWSDGLHQAVEAKEGVKIENENQTLATISFQNYFRMYTKLAGMTGTADTEAEEFAKIYKLDVMVDPHQPDEHPQGLRGRRLQDRAREVQRRLRGDRGARAKTGQPVLVGTVSVEKSEVVASLLKKRGVPHNVLNAKHHAARGRDRRPGRPQGRGHHLHQHGRPRHRHRAGRQPGDDGQARGRARSRTPPWRARTPEAFEARRAEWAGAAGAAHRRAQGPVRRGARRGGGRWAASTSSAPSATSRAASTTSCAAAPAARATRAPRASTCRSRTT